MSVARILLVEDTRSVAKLIENILTPEGFTVIHAEDGQVAWDILCGGDMNFDTLILDREMPRMNGMELLRKIKATPEMCLIPVVMETSLSDAISVQEGLAAGAYYYLAKPFSHAVMLSVVKAAVAQYREYGDLRESVRLSAHSFHCMLSGTFQFRTLDECRMMSQSLARACPQPERVVSGLMELMLNAVEHGNLGIGYDEKSSLITNDVWRDEVNRRLESEQGSTKYALAQFERMPDMIKITIQDQGKGFDWKKYVELASSRAFDNHGRGIAMSRMLSFDELQYSGNGNTVTATITTQSPAPTVL